MLPSQRMTGKEKNAYEILELQPGPEVDEATIKKVGPGALRRAG